MTKVKDNDTSVKRAAGGDPGRSSNALMELIRNRSSDESPRAFGTGIIERPPYLSFGENENNGKEIVSL